MRTNERIQGGISNGIPEWISGAIPKETSKSRWITKGFPREIAEEVLGEPSEGIQEGIPDWNSLEIFDGNSREISEKILG